MRTLRQIEEDFRQLDQKQGRHNPFYSKRKITAKTKATKQKTSLQAKVPAKLQGEDFWDVLAPQEDTGMELLPPEDDFSNVAFGNTSRTQSRSSTRRRRHRNAQQTAEVNSLRLRPAAVQHRVSSMVQRTQSSMQQEFNSRRHGMKRAIKGAAKSANQPPRHRKSVLGDYINRSPSPNNRRLRNRSKSMIVRSPSRERASPTSRQQAQRSDSPLSRYSSEASGLEHQKQQHSFASESSRATERVAAKRRPQSATKKRRTRSQSAADLSDSAAANVAPEQEADSSSSSHLDHIQEQLTRHKRQIKTELQQIGYDDAEFYQFRIRVQNNSMMNVQESKRVFMIITQDDNPALTAKVHDLKIGDDMHVIFPTSRLVDKTIFNPIDHLTWVQRPIDLFGHSLSVEIFVGLGVETSVIAQANVHYTAVDGIPLPKELGSRIRHDAPRSLEQLDQIIQEKKYTTERIQQGESTHDAGLDRSRNRTSEVGAHEDYLSNTDRMEQALLGVGKNASKVLRMPPIQGAIEKTVYRLRRNSTQSSFSDDSEDSEDSRRRVKVLKINMKHKGEQVSKESKGEAKDFYSSLTEDSTKDSTRDQTTNSGKGPFASSAQGGGDLSQDASRNAARSRAPLPTHESIDHTKLEVDPSAVNYDDISDEDDDDLEEERGALHKSKQELKALRERLRNRMEAGMV